jgi:hypothetical protein
MSANKETQKDTVHGEGNYEASRQYNEATKAFVESGRVDKAARDAAPKTAAEAADMDAAEEVGLQHAKGMREKAKDPDKSGR